MEKAIVSSESGDWFLVPYDKREEFWEDELEERVNYGVTYISSPSAVKIKEFEIV